MQWSYQPIGRSNIDTTRQGGNGSQQSVNGAVRRLTEALGPLDGFVLRTGGEGCVCGGREVLDGGGSGEDV